MVHKLCPDCDSQVPVACKSCYCGYNFLKKKGPGKSEKEKTESVTPNSHISSDNIIGGSLKSRRTSRTKRERPDYYSASEYENQIRRLSRTSVSSEKSATGVDLPSPRRRGRGRPPKHGNKRRTLKKQTVKPEPSKEEDKDEDVYVNIPPDKAFVYGVCLADINRKIQGQWNGPENSQNGMKNAMKRTRRTSDFAKS